MRSPAGATAFGRSSDLLDQVDYRLAQTPEEKEEIYNLDTVPIFAKARSMPPSSASPISMTIAEFLDIWRLSVSGNSTVPCASAC